MGATKYVVEHRFRQPFGECVLLAGMETAEHRDRRIVLAQEFVFGRMSKLRNPALMQASVFGKPNNISPRDLS